jgi:hypothetical protein
MKNITTTTATVAFPAGKFFPSQIDGQPRCNVIFSLPNGGQAKVYGSDKDAALLALQKGQAVTLVHDGRAYSVADVQPSAAASPFPAAQPLAPSQRQAAPADKAEIRQARRKYTQALVGEYAAIFQEVCNGMEKFSLKDSELKDISTSLFIQTVRHFNQ